MRDREEEEAQSHFVHAPGRRMVISNTKNNTNNNTIASRGKIKRGRSVQTKSCPSFTGDDSPIITHPASA
jgi:hypothetical protein